MKTSHIIVRLARTNMTVMSAVTHLAAAIMSTTAELPPKSHVFSLSLFLRSWLFVLLTQFATHFLGEVFDYKSDVLNRHGTLLTGGSRVLTEKRVSPRFALRLAIVTIILDLIVIFTCLPKQARILAVVMLFLAYAYSGPPMSLNFRALGEIEAAFITSFLVPHFSAVCQGATEAWPIFYPPLALLVIPPFLAKVALFLLLNMEDRRPDWAGGKITLAVVLGHKRSAQLHAFLMFSAYASAAGIIISRIVSPKMRDADMPLEWYHSLALLFLVPAAAFAWRLSVRLLRHKEFRMSSLLPAALVHSTLLVWSILAYAIFMTSPFHGIVQPYTPLIFFFGYLSVRNFFPKRRKKQKAVEPTPSDVESQSASEQSGKSSEIGTINRANTSPRNDLLGPNGTVGRTHPDQSERGVDNDARGSTGQQTAPSPLSHDVVVIGGGVAGLVSALTLDAQGLRVLVLERRGRNEAVTGADVALWPGAIKILKSLGIPEMFFSQECFALHTVHMCSSKPSSSSLSSLEESETGQGSEAATEILTTIDMDSVTEGTGEHFVLVSRNALMSALWRIVPSDLIVYGADVTSVREEEEAGYVHIRYESEAVEHALTSRVVIAADGARSQTRSLIDSNLGGSAGIRYCGEVCYRGVLTDIAPEIRTLLPDGPEDAVMRINNDGAGLRSSYGYMSGDGRVVYWWVKEMRSSIPDGAKLSHCLWPSPLKELHDATPDDAFYMHPIEDGAALKRWTSLRVALVGDAAHLVTPNMGQGACMATEDAFVLSVLLCRYWQWPDGHTEAFYEYERARKPFAAAVAAEAKKQLFLGQLTSSWGVWLRETFLRLVPPFFLQKTLKKNNFDVNEYICLFEEAVSSRKH